ncbi:hypothetical protein LTR09_005330 [Extremus antarcticus]|uniref:Uncharacterized protein n=1 Tax=Extremus antarcticus TaxID=702011 RepID=A0AAJ0DGE1_9PEZI|nr:hypothetical protein LTR09_005330 [Extremus antarcticus]
MEFTKLMSADLTGQVMPFSLGSDPSAERSMFLPEQIAHLFTPPESIPRSPTANLRSLIRRPRASVGAQRVAALISHNLKSYPRMMSQRNNLPPFIHPHILAVAPENNHLAPLTNCMNLVHMVGGGIQGSRALFWRNVRTECEDWSVKPWKLGRWELLAAMQALLIYIIIRLDEGETEHNNFDSLLVSTVIVICKQSSSLDGSSNAQSSTWDFSLDLSWKTWIYDESIRRLKLTLQRASLRMLIKSKAMRDLPYHQHAGILRASRTMRPTRVRPRTLATTVKAATLGSKRRQPMGGGKLNRPECADCFWYDCKRGLGEV